MGRMYTLDSKLLCGSPEIRIGEKIYSVDDRKNTVKKVMELMNGKKEENKADFESIDEVMKLAFGKNFTEIEKLELSFAAYNELAQIVMSAMTGVDPNEKKEEDFPQSRGIISTSTET